jgi:hypothetical protein
MIDTHSHRRCHLTLRSKLHNTRIIINSHKGLAMPANPTGSRDRHIKHHDTQAMT